MKSLPHPSYNWDTPAFEVVYQVNHQALRWQISEALKELSDDDWQILMGDPMLDTDAALDVVFNRVYDRVISPDLAGSFSEFDAIFDAELHHQLDPLLALPIAA